MQEELKKLISALKSGKLQPETIEAYKKLLIYAETIQGISQDISQALLGFEKLYKEVSQSPLIDQLYPKLNWDITVGKKRRGFWRPEIKISFNSTEPNIPNIKEKNMYNIDLTYSFPIICWTEDNSSPFHPVGECLQGNEPCSVWGSPQIRTKLKFFSSENNRHNSSYTTCHDRTFCYYTFNNPYRNISGIELSLYPEWRPGKPDYTDYAEFLAENICIPYVNEYERRIREALTSEETSEVKISSDSYKKGGQS